MEHSDFYKYASSFQTVVRPGLERIQILCDMFDNPQKDLNFVHVAGTNGKGSVCAYLREMCINEGLITGGFTSPDMLCVNERITVNNKMIEDFELEEIINKISVAAKDMVDKPSQFEIWTMAGFMYFKKKKCDIVILETGLGGRLDATNVIDCPICSVITRIDKDHTEYLGDTVSLIAKEKCGIIKKNSKVVTIEQEAIDVIKKDCEEKSSKLIIAKNAKSIGHDFIHEKFTYDGTEYKSKIPGLYQTENASLAIEAARILGISGENIKKGIENANHIGRFELMKKNPPVIFDGAHNVNGMMSFKKSYDRYFFGKKKAFIVGFMKDKDIENALSVIKDDGDFYFVKVENNDRAESGENIMIRSRKSGEVCENIDEAIKKAEKDHDVVFVCGSLYLYKDLEKIKRG